MDERVYCNESDREINLNECYRMKQSEHCQKCSVRKPAKPQSGRTKIQKGQRLKKKELLPTHHNEIPILVKRPPKDEFTLEEYLANKEEPWQSPPLLSYGIGIELNAFKKTKNPAYVIEAFLAASEAGFYPPLIVLDYIAKVFKEYRKALGKERLDILFFKVGKGQISPYRAMLLRQRDQMLMRDVFKLELLGFTIPEASHMVEVRMANTKGLNQSGQTIPIPKKDTIRDMYFQGWKEAMGLIFCGIDQELLFLEGEEFLKHFPGHSFPPARKNVDKVMLAFRERNGAVRDRLVAQDMFRLELLGFTLAEAAHMAAARFGSIPGCEVKENDIRRKYLQERKGTAYTESKQFTTELLKDSGEKILRLFPNDSFPPRKKNIDRIVKSFRSAHSGVK